MPRFFRFRRFVLALLPAALRRGHQASEFVKMPPPGGPDLTTIEPEAPTMPIAGSPGQDGAAPPASETGQPSSQRLSALMAAMQV